MAVRKEETKRRSKGAGRQTRTSKQTTGRRRDIIHRTARKTHNIIHQDILQEIAARTRGDTQHIATNR